MKCNGCEKDIIGFCICGNRVFLSIFRYNSNFTLIRDFSYDFIEYFPIRLNYCLEFTSLNEKRFGWIVLRYWIYVTIWAKHRITSKDSFYYLIISLLIRWKSAGREINVRFCIFAKKSVEYFFCRWDRVLCWVNKITKGFYFLVVHILKELEYRYCKKLDIFYLFEYSLLLLSVEEKNQRGRKRNWQF